MIWLASGVASQQRSAEGDGEHPDQRALNWSRPMA